MKRILFLLLFFSSATFASDFWTDGWPIYIYGDVQSVEMIFNAIAMIISSGTYQTAIEIVIFLGILVGIYGFMGSGQFNQLFYSGAFIVVMVGIMTATPMLSKVHIIDKRVDYGVYSYGAEPNYAVVDNVPIFISLPASFGSLLSYGLTNIVDTATSAIDPDLQASSFSRLGYGENINLAYDILPLLEFRSGADASPITGAVAPCNTFNDYDRCLDSYVRQCGEIATMQSAKKIDNFTRPTKPLIESISPSNLGVSGTDNLTFDGVPYSCTNFYNTYLLPSSAPIANHLAKWVKDSVNIELDSPQGRQFLELTYGLDNVTETMAGSAGKLEDFFYTFAASKTIASSLLKSGMGAEYTTSDYTGDILNYKALAKANIEGATMWSFISNILPLVMHFIMLVAYAVGIFVFLFAFMYGWAKGTMLIGTYMLNIIALSMMMPVLAFVHNLVNAYMSKSGLNNLDSQMRDTRVGSLDTIGYIGDYMSTMSGVAGFLGAVVLFAIPTLVATGKVSGLMSGAASAIRGMRDSTGKDAASAMKEGTTAQSQMERGAGVHATDQKSQLKAQANQLGWGQLTSIDTAKQAGFLEGQKSAITDQTKVDNLSPTLNAQMTRAEVGTSIESGKQMLQQRQQQGLLDKNGNTTSLMSKSMATNHGADAAQLAEAGKLTSEQRSDYIQGSGEQAKQRLGRTAGFVPQQDNFDMFEAGRREGVKGRASTEQGFNADADRGIFNEKGELSTKAARGMYNQASDQAVSLLGAGSKSYTDEQWKEKQQKASTEYEAGFRDVKGFNAATTGKNEDGTSRKEQYLQAREDSSKLQTAGMMGSTSGKMEEIEQRAARTGESIVKAAESLEKSLAGAKTRADSAKVEYFGDEGFRALSAKSELNSLDNKAKTLAAEEKAEKINSDGSLTKEGAQAVMNDTSNKTAEQMRRAKIFGSEEEVGKFVKNGVNNLKAEEQDKVLDAMHKDGLVLNKPTRREDGTLDWSTMKVASGIDAAIAIGKGAGNRFFDKLGGAVYGGWEFNGNADAVRTTKDSSVHKNDSYVENHDVKMDGIAKRKMINEAMENGTTWDEALNTVETAETGLQTKELADRAGLTDMLSGGAGGYLAGKAMEGDKAGGAPKKGGGSKGLKALGKTKLGLAAGVLTSTFLGNMEQEQQLQAQNQIPNANYQDPQQPQQQDHILPGNATVNKVFDFILGEEGNYRTQTELDKGNFFSGLYEAGKGLAVSSANTGLAVVNSVGAFAQAAVGVGEGNSVGERFSNNLDAFYNKGLFGAQDFSNLAYNTNNQIQTAQATLDLGGYADFNNPMVASQMFENNPQAMQAYNNTLAQARSDGFSTDQGVITGQMVNGQMQFQAMTNEQYMNAQDHNAMLAQQQLQGQGQGQGQGQELTVKSNNEGMLTKQDTDQYLMSVNSKASQAVSGVRNISKDFNTSMDYFEDRLADIDKKVKRNRA